MIRRQIQLTKQQDDALREMAETRGVSIAEIVRQSVARYVVDHGAKNDDRLTRAMELIGKFSTGVRDLAANHDRYLSLVEENSK